MPYRLFADAVVLWRDVQIALGLFALAVNAAVYLYAWLRAR